MWLSWILPHPILTHTLAENHSKDYALYKACQQSYGTSIPRAATNLFVKNCPVCIKQVKVAKKKVAGFQPIITKGFAKRGQVRAYPALPLPAHSSLPSSSPLPLFLHLCSSSPSSSLHLFLFLSSPLWCLPCCCSWT